MNNCSKWISVLSSHLRISLRYEIILRNSFLQNKARIVYKYINTKLYLYSNNIICR